MVLRDVKTENKGKRELQDQRDDLDGTWAQIVVTWSSDEKREHMKGEESGAWNHLLPAFL